MKRVVLLGVLGLAITSGQTPDLATLEQTAQKRNAEWESIAKDLSERMARILPCDPRYTAGITEVSKASEARLAALADYLRAASAQAFAETATAKILLNTEERRAMEVAMERADTGKEQTAVDTQSDALAQSVKQRSSLEEPRKLLEQIAAMVRQRVADSEQRIKGSDAAVRSLQDLVTKLDARDAALREESVAFEAERARWNGYYAARLARAQIECAITQDWHAGRPRQIEGETVTRYCYLGLSGMLICCVAGLIAQTGREAYRQAYDVWRRAHGDLERDAGAGGPEQVAQADRAGAAVASFEATRIAHLKSSAEEGAQRRQAIIFQNALTRPSADLEPQAAPGLVASELQTATRTIARFADDKDRGIQQFRQALERERVALTALRGSIEVSQKTAAATSAAAAAMEESRVKAAHAFGDQAAPLSQTVEQLEKENAAWSGYYEKLARAIQVANAPPPPVSVISAAPRTDSIPRVPLPRFVGAWTYPMVNGIFHGVQPEFVDLVIHEQSGHADGTLYGRFKPPPGSATDPVVRFDFQGDFSGTATQKFALVTSDGAKGTIELIPGPAFNLLEVNFQTEPRVNKIRASNFILVKK